MGELTLRHAQPQFSQAPRFQAMLDELGLNHEPSLGGMAFREESARGELSGRLDPVLRRDRERTELFGVRLTLRVPLEGGGRMVRFREWRLRMFALAQHARDLPRPEKPHRPRWIETRPRLVVGAGLLALLIAALMFFGAAIALSFLLI